MTDAHSRFQRCSQSAYFRAYAGAQRLVSRHSTEARLHRGPLERDLALDALSVGLGVPRRHVDRYFAVRPDLPHGRVVDANVEERDPLEQIRNERLVLRRGRLPQSAEARSTRSGSFPGALRDRRARRSGAFVVGPLLSAPSAAGGDGAWRSRTPRRSRAACGRPTCGRAARYRRGTCRRGSRPGP